jgi:UTP--glucose-1-phosphate uridylyltransferase
LKDDSPFVVRSDRDYPRLPKQVSSIVNKAVIPAAGLGSRMVAITKGVPKEMLPLGLKPMIQHVVEEAVGSGLHEICIVIREGKESIRDYFQSKQDTTRKFDQSGNELERVLAACRLTFVCQEKPRGLGDALLQARDFVGNQSFVMILPDQLMISSAPATSQLLNHAQAGPIIWTSLVRLPKPERKFFTGARGFEFERCADSDELLMGRIQTEEETCATFHDEDYELRGFGRTIFPPEIFDYLGEEYVNPQSGEVDLLRTFQGCTKRLGHRGVVLDGEPLDLGTPEGYYRYLLRFQESNT